MDFQCPTFRRGSAEYETVRRNAVWNGLKPERYPEIIVQASTKDDVVLAVTYAASCKMKIGVRSGGHSWTSSFLRQDGMLIDVSRLKDITVDPDTGTATVGPGVHGGNLNEQLKDHGYMFPGGHCPTVGLGGYLLQGGFGWNSRLYGTGCENILAVDVVVADGKLVHASPDENQDLYWAARGAGHGFFGVVTRFHLRCHPLPRAIINSRFWIPADSFDELISTLDNVHERFPRHLEVSVFIGHEQEGVPGFTALLRADSLGQTRVEARQALEIVHRLPVLSKAVKADIFRDLEMGILLDNIGDLLEVSDHQFVVDNTWMDEPIRAILPQLHKMMATLGPSPSHLYLLYWNRKGYELPDMAFSLEGKVYMSYFAIYKDPTEYPKWSKSIAEGIASVADQGIGSQLADENLSIRPTRFMAPENFVRLEKLRLKYDPSGLFQGFMGLPEDFKALVANF